MPVFSKADVFPGASVRPTGQSGFPGTFMGGDATLRAEQYPHRDTYALGIPFGVSWRSVVQENSGIIMPAKDVASRTGLRPPPWALNDS